MHRLTSMVQEDEQEIREILGLDHPGAFSSHIAFYGRPPLLIYLRPRGFSVILRPCDENYYQQLVEQRLRPSGAQFTPTRLPLSNCMSMLQFIWGKVFDLHLEPAPARTGEVPHPDFCKFAVRNSASGEPVGTIYTDLAAREGKSPRGPAHYTVQTGRLATERGDPEQLPVVVVDCAFQTLLSLEDAGTLFHEFGLLFILSLARGLCLFL
jgi:Zn-dependent oligopeptidase